VSNNDSAFKAIAKRKLAELTVGSHTNESLYDFVVRVNPTYEKPVHLTQLVDLLEQVESKPMRLCFSMPPRHSKPLGENTLVTMADGSLRRIQDISPGDKVISGKGRITTVLDNSDNGILPVYLVKTLQGREFLAEGTHRFLTQDGWKRVQDLRVYAKDNWQRPRGDQLMSLAGYEISANSLDANSARLLGYFVGDGNCTQRNLRFTNADPIVVESFKQCVRLLGDEVVEDYKYNYRVITSKYTRRAVGKLLEEHLVLGKTAAFKTVPDAIMQAHPEVVREFIAAYFECDGTRGGCSDPNKVGANASFSSVSKDLLYKTQHLLARLGIRSSLYAKVGTYNDNEHVSWCLSILDQAKFFDIIPVRGAKSGPKKSSRRLERERELPDTVVSITEAGTAHCYCLTVEHDESFLAEGLITHNTETIAHFIARYLVRHPDRTVGYCSYSSALAENKSRVIRRYFETAGGELDSTSKAASHWSTRSRRTSSGH
jgi:intein/homing endonuclease